MFLLWFFFELNHINIAKFNISIIIKNTLGSGVLSMNTRFSQSQSTTDSLEAMRRFSQAYAKRTGTFFCSDVNVTAVVIEGLAKHKDQYGAPLCPCRHYQDKEKEVLNSYWNCPCVPMRERKECHCMLFLTPDNEFSSDKQSIKFERLLSEIS
uniref:ferredoxin-thioredoxin reductase beta subunit n=1 Tax=Gloiopeltis furcata TaxID=42017 RepID=UPI0028D6189D|nr:ferredoxin-thioredoxin reductase beta subunit [Gloiopeltis furcata]WMP13837.1 ferredoxin-thioredoxin reductase beta subunit [Gloiopeltis furcata]